MFTTFLAATAAVVSALLGGLLLRPRRDVAPMPVSPQSIVVAALTVGLLALGLWMV